MSSAPSTRSSESPWPGPSSWAAGVRRWAPVVVWAAFISWFSSDAFSARSTNSYIDPVLRFLFGELTPAGFRLAHSIVRKGAHLTEYAILGALICRAMTAPGARVSRAVALRATACCAAYALLDEAHQALVPSRTGSGVDVLIDATGAALGALLFTRSRERRGAAPDQ
ncbi:MAG: VanZ family protein [Deltaproteobacteria bacterium]|nr:VanZ family protein [Deltaproteobacteria bacterium]